MSKTILVVDDEENIRELIKFNLEKEGYKVITVAHGNEVMGEINPGIDLVVLDLMLPGEDGLSLCRRIRNDEKIRSIPIIMLTAKGEEVDRILGLEMGADDYITKPFSPRELVARIKAILRRIELLNNEVEIKDENKVINRGDLELNIQSHELKKKEQLLDLTPKEFALMKYLLLNVNKVLTRDLLLEKIWGYDYTGDTRTVDVHIRRLRKKIGEEYIKTVRGVGYKFVEKVE